jgi:RNA polymerase sigma-70 factor (ECF subfamily)
MPDPLRSLFELWYPRLVRYLRRRVADADQAEDIAQEAFVRLLDHRPRDPAAWLFSVATNLATDEARLARGRARRLSVIRAAAALERDPGPEERMVAADDAERVRRALMALSVRDRTLLVLHHHGWRYREIAARVGVAPSSVGSLLTRAERRLAALLASDLTHAERRASLRGHPARAG